MLACVRFQDFSRRATQRQGSAPTPRAFWTRARRAWRRLGASHRFRGSSPKPPRLLRGAPPTFERGRRSKLRRAGGFSAERAGGVHGFGEGRFDAREVLCRIELGDDSADGDGAVVDRDERDEAQRRHFLLGDERRAVRAHAHQPHMRESLAAALPLRLPTAEALGKSAISALAAVRESSHSHTPGKIARWG